MTRLLLDRGADPNDDETPYHAAESYDLSAQRVLVESGKLNDDRLTTILLRKADWHDYEGMKYLLAHGADPNRMTRWRHTVLHWAIRRDNDLAIIDLLLDHGADPTLVNERDGTSATAMAAHKGRGDVLQSIERRGMPLDLHRVDLLIAACAKADRETMNSMVEEEPELAKELIAKGGTLLAEFAANGNAEGVACLLDLGVNVAAIYEEGDPYFEIARNSTALHFAAWRMRHSVVQLLLQRGSPLNALDGRGRTALALAIRACVDSHWTRWRSLESIQMLVEAGASVQDIDIPTGYPEADEVLRSYQGSRNPLHVSGPD
jgi:ankyrin repeat protein